MCFDVLSAWGVSEYESITNVQIDGQKIDEVIEIAGEDEMHLSRRNKEMSNYYVFETLRNDLIVKKLNENELIIIDNKTEAEIKNGRKPL